MIKLKDYIWEIAIALLVGSGGVLGYLWIEGGSVIAGLEDKRAETKVLLDSLHAQNKELTDDRAATRKQNAALLGLIQDMRAEQNRLRDEVRSLREVTLARLRNVRTLTMPAVVVDTVEELDLPADAIMLLADNTIGFTPDAAYTNLEHLIRGASARKELDLSNQRIAGLEKQIGLDEQILANKDAIIAGQEQELANVRTEMTAEIDLRDAEIKGLKHKLRRSKIKGFFTSLGGLVLGYFLGGLGGG